MKEPDYYYLKKFSVLMSILIFSISFSAHSKIGVNKSLRPKFVPGEVIIKFKRRDLNRTFNVNNIKTTFKNAYNKVFNNLEISARPIDSRGYFYKVKGIGKGVNTLGGLSNKNISTEDLIKSLAEAEVTGQLQKAFSTLARLDLLIIDELGYLELTKKTAALFFQLIAVRYEKKSTIITTNKSFDEWGGIFQDDVVASAILDRLLHHSYPFFIQGKSFRMKNILNK